MSDASPTSPRIGFIGLGNMGLPMSHRILAAGLPLTVWNRRPEKAQPLVDAGARMAASLAELLPACDVVGLCVSDTAAVEELCFGPGGLAAAGRRGQGKVVCDFSSIDPEATATIARRMREATGARWVDSPVSGGVPAAEAGTLIVFAGGDAGDIAQAGPLFDAVSKRVTHMGPTGSGQTTKVCNQMIVAANLMTLAETFATARGAGVDVSRLAAALEGGFADSRPLQIFGPRMAAHSYTPVQSAIALFAKDSMLGQKLARSADVATPVSALVAMLYQTIRKRTDVNFNGDASELVALYDRPETKGQE